MPREEEAISPFDVILCTNRAFIVEIPNLSNLSYKLVLLDTTFGHLRRASIHQHALQPRGGAFSRVDAVLGHVLLHGNLAHDVGYFGDRQFAPAPPPPSPPPSISRVLTHPLTVQHVAQDPVGGCKNRKVRGSKR